MDKIKKEENSSCILATSSSTEKCLLFQIFVYNVYRWYHGYYDHNPAHLIPRPEKEVLKEIYDLIGDSKKLFERARELFAQDKTQLALEVLDILIQVEPENIEALKLRTKLTDHLGKNDSCLMSRNAYYFSSKQDKNKIRELNKKIKSNNN